MQQGGLRTRGIVKEAQPGWPLISIVMVTRNAARHFRQALESVCSQAYSGKEIIIIDGFSDDGTLSIISEFEDVVDYWISEPDKGIYDAMNKGIALCRGEWIGFKNADDWYAPSALEILASCIRKNPQVAIWYGDSCSVLQENPLKTSPFITCHQSIGGNPGIDHRCSFVRASVHKQYLFDLQYRLAADLDVFWRLKKAGMVFMHIPAFMAFKRFGGASDGTRILAESYRINRRHAGWIFALRWVFISRFRYFFLKGGNFILRLILGKEGFHRFKARKMGSTNSQDSVFLFPDQ